MTVVSVKRQRRVRSPTGPTAPSRGRWRSAWLGAAGILLGAPIGATGQAEISPDQLGRIVAVLVDADTRAPIPEAFVSLVGMERRALSDASGTVSFLDIPPGSHELSIRHIAYGEQTVPIEVQSMQSAILVIPLSQEALAVAPLNVLIEHRPRFLELRGFYERRAVGLGQFFDPQFVERWSQGVHTRADRFIDLLLDMSPQMASALGTRASGGPSPVGGILCSGGRPAVYVDGQPVFDDLTGLRGRQSLELEMMSTYTIGAVEIYPGSAGVPDFALEPEIGCGSVVIWTNRWRGRTRELGGGDVERCEPGDDAQAVVEGTIRDEFTGVLLPGAHVLATSYPAGQPRAARSVEVVADRLARYRVCDLRAGHTLTLKVSAADRNGPEIAVPLEGARVTRDLTLRMAGPGDLVGRVTDRQSGRPVAAAVVTVHGGRARAQTDAQGYFALDDVMPGDQVVEISHLGFEPVTEVVSVVADRTVDLRVELSADPISLAPLVVTALRDRRLEIRGYFERRVWGERTGLGHFLDAASIQRANPAATSRLLRDVPGVEVRCTGARDCLVGSTRGPDCEQMSVYINGSLALGDTRRDPVTIDELVRPSEIAGVEVYPSPSSVPAEFSGLSGRCGAIVVWTR